MSNEAGKRPGAAESARLRTSLVGFAIIFVVILVALPIVVEIVVPSRALQAVWIESTDGGRLQKAYGFVLEVRAIDVSGQRLSLPVISSVTPDGRMARAGVRAGDVVMCIPNGRSDFWHQLLAADEGYEAVIRVSSQAEVRHGCAGARAVVFAGRERPRTL